MTIVDKSMHFLSQLSRWSPVAFATVGTLYAISLSAMRIITYESNDFIAAFIDVTKLGVFIPISYFFKTYEKLTSPGREIAMAALVVVELFATLDLYGKNVCGRPYRKVDLSGKVFIVTGSNTGIGYETTIALADMGATVILACRSIEKANAAKDAIVKATRCAPSKLIVLKLDLCSFNSVREFVKAFLALGVPLHCLINNAGLMMQDRNTTPDGHEMVFTANHLSHFLLTNLLLPELEKTSGRIVNLSSALHKTANSFNFDDIMSEKSYTLFGTYSQSKLANILFTLELHDRLKAKGSKVTCNAVHPGLVRTEVTRHMHVVMQFLNYLFASFLQTLQKTPPQGAYCSLYAATDPSLNQVSGKYFVDSVVSPLGVGARDAQARKRLWEISEEITGLRTVIEK